jgi:hypothetical protein
MTALFIAVLASLRATTRSRLKLAAEILALRHQLAVLQRTTPKRPPSVRSIGSSGWCSQVPGQPGCAGVRGAGLEGWSPDQKKAIVGEAVAGEESGHDPAPPQWRRTLQAALASGRS